MRTRAICAIFLLSGTSGLIYQVVWVRWFGRVFGNTVHSAALVIAVFMAGLGIGSYAVGAWIDRRAATRPRRALAAYGAAEVGIALLGGALALVLPALEPLSAHLTFYTEGANGWSEPSALSMVVRFAIAIFILAPITALMGGTLTLLARYLVAAEIERAGWKIGLLYGFNTAGAALGAFATDFALVPSLGLRATQLVAVALNLAAALATFRLLRSTPERDGVEDAPPRDVHRPDRVIVWTAVAIFLSGFCAMGVEILWFRQFSIALGGYRSVFSLLLTVILVGIWLGSVAGGLVHRYFGRPALLYMLTQALFICLTMLWLATFRIARGTAVLGAESYLTSIGDRLLVSWGVLEPILIVAGLPAFLMGFAYPLANANIQSVERAVGRRAGLLYLANTSGAVLGSLCAGFLFIPHLGLRGSIVVLALVGLASIAALVPAGREPGRRGSRLGAAPALACLAAVLGAIALWLRVPEDRFVRFGIAPQEKLLHVSEGIYELIAVTQLPGQDLLLKTNGHNMSGTNKGAQRYMRAFSHVPLLHLEKPSDVLVICFGVGTTVHAASLHPSVERLEVADLSRHVLEQASYFAGSNRNVLADPRVRVFVNDGRQHLWMRPEGSYDLITLEPPPLAFAGVSALYSADFYRLARSRLRAGGFLSQWLPAYQLPEPTVRSMVRAFVDVFPDAILLSGFRNELILLGSKGDAITIDPVELQRRLDFRPRVKADMATVGMGTVTEIIGSFVSSSENLRRATRDSDPVTDDFPSMEYAAPATNCWTTHFPRQLIDPASVETWCPRCFAGGRPVAAAGPLASYLKQHLDYYLSEEFLVHTTCPWPTPAPGREALQRR